MRTEHHIQGMLDKVTKLVESSRESMQRDILASADIDQAVEVKQIYLSYAVALLDMLAWGCPPDVSDATIQAIQPILSRLKHNVEKATNDN